MSSFRNRDRPRQEARFLSLHPSLYIILSTFGSAVPLPVGAPLCTNTLLIGRICKQQRVERWCWCLCLCLCRGSDHARLYVIDVWLAVFLFGLALATGTIAEDGTCLRAAAGASSQRVRPHMHIIIGPRAPSRRHSREEARPNCGLATGGGGYGDMSSLRTAEG